jgi:hypothetical protein
MVRRYGGQVSQLLVLFWIRPAARAEAGPPAVAGPAAEGATRQAATQSLRARGHGRGWGVGEESGDTPPQKPKHFKYV